MKFVVVDAATLDAKPKGNRSPMVSILQPSTSRLHKVRLSVTLDADGDVAFSVGCPEIALDATFHLDTEAAEQLLAALDLILGDN